MLLKAVLKHSYIHKYDRNASAICRAAFKTSGATIASSTILTLLKGDGKITQAKLDALDGCLIIPPKTDMTYSAEELRAICRGIVSVRLTDFDRVNRFHDFMLGVIYGRRLTVEDVAPQIDKGLAPNAFGWFWDGAHRDPEANQLVRGRSKGRDGVRQTIATSMKSTHRPPKKGLGIWNSEAFHFEV
ncbi:MAG: hypothetical protein F6K42_12440 [Leptolyngbya sp. SIO1D8]|nr:hypothetical protein [Leptolyngbya sp. SIO1D8]